MRRTARLAAASAALALCAAPARAVDVADGQLSLHGDGQWAYQRSTSRNAFGDATPEGNYDTTIFDLVLVVRPAEDLVLSTQLGFDTSDVGVEWAFAEWRLSDRLRLRIGKVQQPFGNLNELRFAGTTRPLFALPTAVYGPANVVGTAYLGLGATGVAAADGPWRLGYDLYGGALKLDELEPHAALPRPGEPDSEVPVAVETQQVRDVVGGRLSLSTPLEVTARLSGFYGRLVHGERSEAFLVWGAGVEHRGDRLWLSAEAFRSEEVGGERAWAAYATAAWSITEQLQAAVQYEWQRTSFAGSPSDALLRHDGLEVGLAWWINPSLVCKGSWQQLSGNRFAFRELTAGLPSTPADLLALPSRRTTGVLTLGTQFSF